MSMRRAQHGEHGRQGGRPRRSDVGSAVRTVTNNGPHGGPYGITATSSERTVLIDAQAPGEGFAEGEALFLAFEVAAGFHEVEVVDGGGRGLEMGEDGEAGGVVEVAVAVVGFSGELDEGE